jgi:hypothetical protein
MFWEFQAINRTWPTLDKFYYSHFLNLQKKYYKGLYKNWNKIMSLDMKKKVKCNIMLGPPGEFLGVFGYLIENQYKLEHFKYLNV